MTSAGPNPSQSHYQVIFHCIESASRFVPPVLSPAAALQSLRDLIPSLPAVSAMAETDDGPPTSAQQTLGLVGVAAEMLSHLDESSSANPLGWETVSGIGRVLDELTGQLGATVRREKADLVRGLYVIIDPQVTGGRDPLTIAQAAIQGGARMLQLRDKLRDKGESLPLARELQTLCHQAGASLILNDHADVAAIVGAAGLHVGQTDLPVEQARQVLAPHQVLGRSNHEIEELGNPSGWALITWPSAPSTTQTPREWGALLRASTGYWWPGKQHKRHWWQSAASTPRTPRRSSRPGPTPSA